MQLATPRACFTGYLLLVWFNLQYIINQFIENIRLDNLLIAIAHRPYY